MLEALYSGLLDGLLYAAVALGLALIWGITDVINFAHGEFLMLGMYAAYWLFTLAHLDPLLSAPLVAVVLGFFGFGVYALIIRRLRRGPPTAVILATFGLGLVMRQAAAIAFTPNYRNLSHTFLSGSVTITGVHLGRPQFVTALIALALVAVVFWLVYRTRWGQALQAVAEDREVAAFVGISPQRVDAQVWMLSSAVVGLVGALLTSFFYIFPSVGAVFGLLAFVAVCMGGFGSLLGAALAGLLIGLIESFTGYLIEPALKTLGIFVLFVAVLWWRPRGLFGRW
ncbi:MAG: branched-chain amino acid ABC transporter permease [Betaproteobacteria bacterium]|jgi:branched-chain amino acid transport system permease protein|nr:branched-chain amino acid ABC transporter permease [Betaproteobacteria bacterium]MBU6511483.1 branched-chain amino acid ABC transporter permease [Betaproteobacteria bacterium]MDE1954866.1 branched-chain amino acid ABC transporter permease [Betaproteobacteria bacterium]MDE2151137.1 branched-chain amino acid ABC transporter permease [Betaproteobacteria bacterium]MDE2480300.1 branched-chain amino acid ABC transporter permease [Betaproteobacteria bacterium]